MKEKQSSNFLFGFLVGALLCVLVWYWQKSTSADEGALDLLDRLAAAERRLGQLRAELAATVSKRKDEPAPPATVQAAGPDDLRQVRGIGPVFDGRLRQAGVDTLTKLASTTAGRLSQILKISENRAETILAEAVKVHSAAG